MQVFCRCCIKTETFNLMFECSEMYQQMAAVCKCVLYLDVAVCYLCVIVSPCSLQSSETFDEHETSNRSKSVCGQTGSTGCSDRTASLVLKRAVCFNLCLPLCVSPRDSLILPAGNCCLGLKVENVNMQSE